MEKPIPDGAAEDFPAEQKFWEGPYPDNQAHLADKGIQGVAEKLKRAGRHFELTEDESEYVLRVEGFPGIMHITKVNDPGNVDLGEIIAYRITHPEG